MPADHISALRSLNTHTHTHTHTHTESVRAEPQLNGPGANGLSFVFLLYGLAWGKAVTVALCPLEGRYACVWECENLLCCDCVFGCVCVCVWGCKNLLCSDCVFGCVCVCVCVCVEGGRTCCVVSVCWVVFLCVCVVSLCRG